MKAHWSTIILLLMGYSIILLVAYTLILNYLAIVLIPFLFIPLLLVLIYENTTERSEAKGRTPSNLLLLIFAITLGGVFGVLFFGIGLYGILLVTLAALLVVISVPSLLSDDMSND